MRKSAPRSPATEPDLGLDPDFTTRILCGFIKSEVRRAGRSSVVVGLSGGLDSSVAACLAVRALGPQSVLGLVMPYRSSHPTSAAHAELVLGALGIIGERVEITPLIDAFSAISRPGSRVRLGNAMARVRMILLYDRSAENDALVLGTSNKTEMLLGYGTLHGDLASAINPLGDLYKTQVRALAEYLRVPPVIRRKRPSADLWPRQSDEGELGFTYDTVDRLLALLVDARVTRRSAIAAGFSPALVNNVMERVVRSQFKRRPPVVAKVSTRSVGWDFRYPRDWKS